MWGGTFDFEALAKKASEQAKNYAQYIETVNEPSQQQQQTTSNEKSGRLSMGLFNLDAMQGDELVIPEPAAAPAPAPAQQQPPPKKETPPPPPTPTITTIPPPSAAAITTANENDTADDETPSHDNIDDNIDDDKTKTIPKTPLAPSVSAPPTKLQTIEDTIASRTNQTTSSSTSSSPPPPDDNHTTEQQPSPTDPIADLTASIRDDISMFGTIPSTPVAPPPSTSHAATTTSAPSLVIPYGPPLPPPVATRAVVDESSGVPTLHRMPIETPSHDFAANDVNAMDEDSRQSVTVMSSVDRREEGLNDTTLETEEEEEEEADWTEEAFGEEEDEDEPVMVLVTEESDSTEEERRTNTTSVRPTTTEKTTPKPSSPPRQQPEPQQQQQPAAQPPDFIIEKFMSQIQRLEEHHQEEHDKMTQQYNHRLQELESQLDEVTQDRDRLQSATSQQQPPPMPPVDKKAIQEECQLKLARMEEKYTGLLEKQMDDLERYETENEELLREVESLRSHKMNTADKLGKLQKSVQGIHDEQKAKIVSLEEQLAQLSKEKNSNKVVVDGLTSSLTNSQAEKQEAITQYENLKSRVKVVATELKERRQECRELNIHVNTLQSENSLLKSSKDTYQKDLDQLKKLHENDDVERMEMKETINKLQKELNDTKQALDSKESVSEKTLLAYKKKAQNALALANARAATAQNSREEMEMEVSNSKSAAVEAEQRARIAETEKRDIVKTMEDERRIWEEMKEMLEGERTRARKMMEEMEDKIDRLENDLGYTQESHKKLEDEVAKLEDDLKQENNKNCILQQDLTHEKSVSADLQRKLEIARLEHERSAAAAFFAKQKEAQKDEHERQNDHPQNTEADGTIALLQEELDGANEAIKELKEALKGALIANNNSNNTTAARTPASYNSLLSPPTIPPHQQSSSLSDATNSSTPLFYALEKQAELQSARDEIFRLANLLGDAETEKMDAFEAMEVMRKKMEDADARLRRYEKLGRSQGSNSSSNALSAFDSSHNNAESANAAVNLEYLKNVTLSYLNAQTLNERRRLLPVLAEVLCLTEDEQRRAKEAVETSSGLQGVGSAFIETLETTTFSSLFS